MAVSQQAVPVSKQTPGKRDLRDAVHLVSQAKGGIGKSTVARLLGEYLKSKYGRVRCFDTDPSQPTFERIGGLGVQRVGILRDGEIDPMLINPMLNEIMNDNGPFVIDTGSSSYHALWSYIAGANLFELLADNDRPVLVHVPLAAAPDLEDTLTGFEEIAEHSPAGSVVVWIIEREKQIQFEGGKTFFELPVTERQNQKLFAAVISGLQRHRWNRETFGEILANRQTIEEALKGGNTITRSYIRRVKDEIWASLEVAGL